MGEAHRGAGDRPVTAMLLVATPALPLLLASCALHPAWRRAVGAAAPWAVLPALAALVVRPGGTVSMPWLFLGAGLELDDTGRVFLGLAAIIFLAAALFARSSMPAGADRDRFLGFLLAAMAGSLGLPLAGDVVTFLFFYTLISLAAYGLIVHDRTDDSRRAGRTYLGLAIIGESLLFCAIVLTAWSAGDTSLEQMRSVLPESGLQRAVVGLAVVGLAAKMVLVPLHVAAPLAYAASPAAAAAVLSGAVSKAGVLGCLRLLPMGEPGISDWGGVLVVAGAASALWGVTVGLTQTNARVVLAYSSISQLGFIAVALGHGMLAPASWAALAPVPALIAFHHAMAKGSLFLGTDVAAAASGSRGRTAIIVGLAVPALALAGLPLTSGAFAKAALKEVAGAGPWHGPLAAILPLTAIGTTLLMSRFVLLARPSDTAAGRTPGPARWLPWAIPIAAVVVLPWWWRVTRPEIAAGFDSLAAAGASLWPIGVGLAAAAVVARWPRVVGPLRAVRLPPGDILVPLEQLVAAGRRLWTRRLAGPLFHAPARIVLTPLLRLPATADQRWLPWLASGLERWTTMTIAAVLLAVILFIILAL